MLSANLWYLTLVSCSLVLSQRPCKVKLMKVGICKSGWIFNCDRAKLTSMTVVFLQSFVDDNLPLSCVYFDHMRFVGCMVGRISFVVQTEPIALMIKMMKLKSLLLFSMFHLNTTIFYVLHTQVPRQRYRTSYTEGYIHQFSPSSALSLLLYSTLNNSENFMNI